MYFHLLKALHEMESGGTIPIFNGLSPFVNELDLYITATDIRGLTVDLPVANAHVRESRFRYVFRFHYSTQEATAGKYKSRYGLKDEQAEWLYKAIHRLSSPEKITENFRSGYSIDREFSPRDTMLVGSRSLRVLGNLLNGLSGSHKAFSTPAKWITSVGDILAGILAVALPNSLGDFLFAGYWVWLLYIFEILLGLAGWLFGAMDVQQIGIYSFAITFIAHLLLTLMSKWLDKRLHFGMIRALVSILAVLLTFGVLFLMYIGLLDLGIFKMHEGLLGEWLRQITA